jgi:hypothetical protein
MAGVLGRAGPRSTSLALQYSSVSVRVMVLKLSVMEAGPERAAAFLRCGIGDHAHHERGRGRQRLAAQTTAHTHKDGPRHVHQTLRSARNADARLAAATDARFGVRGGNDAVVDRDARGTQFTQEL